MKLSIHGCRGSVPTSSGSIHKYGGNTSCFEIITENKQIIFDAGTGVKNVKFSKSRASFLLLSHFHHDHIQGLPFNPELFDPKNEIIISSGLCDIELVKQTNQKCFSPPYFPFDVVSLLSNINVSSKGKITATYGFDDEEIIGNFILASFPNETGLRQVGNNRYQTNSKSGLPNFGIPMNGAFGKIEAGNLERSNVDVTSEMITMLKAQQAFSGVSRLLQTEVDITKRLIDG